MTERAALIDFFGQWGLAADLVLWFFCVLWFVSLIAWAVGRLGRDL